MEDFKWYYIFYFQVQDENMIFMLAMTNNNIELNWTELSLPCLLLNTVSCRPTRIL